MKNREELRVRPSKLEKLIIIKNLKFLSYFEKKI